MSLKENRYYNVHNDKTWPHSFLHGENMNICTYTSLGEFFINIAKFEKSQKILFSLKILKNVTSSWCEKSKLPLLTIFLGEMLDLNTLQVYLYICRCEISSKSVFFTLPYAFIYLPLWCFLAFS